MSQREADHRTEAIMVLARISEGDPIRVLVGGGRTEPASELVLTAPAEDALRALMTRGLMQAIREAKPSEGDAMHE